MSTKSYPDTPADAFAKILNLLAEYITCESARGVKEFEFSQDFSLNFNPSIKVKYKSDAVNKLEEIVQAVSICKKCSLYKERKRPVPGEGCYNPDIMFVGEAPGFEEDCAGRPFVGAAGELLTRMIEAMGYKREDVFIANVIKCRPPGNRTPYPDEVSQCLPYLNEQIAILKPRVIIALGAAAVKAFFGKEVSISKIRGRFMTYRNIAVMPTYHPAFLLRSPAHKKDVWADLRKVLSFLGRLPTTNR